MSISERKYERHKQKQLDLSGIPLSVKLRPLPEEYKNPFRLNDCEVCYNPLSADMYNDCTFFCKYCFIRNRLMSLFSAFFDNWNPDTVRPADFSIVEERFKVAFSRSRRSTTDVSALRHGIPIHFGVLTENFQPLEHRHGLSYKFLQLIREYQYPIIISTKSDMVLEDKYFKILTDLPHLIMQVSFSTTNAETSKALEPAVPNPERRLEILETFKESGVRSMMRVAPIIAPITDKQLYQTISDAAGKVDGVLMKGMFFGGNKTVNKFFKKSFNIDLYDYLKSSGTTPYDGGNVCYNPQAQNIFTAKAVNLCESLGMAGNVDTMLSPIISTHHHCCGGDGLEGFNPHSYEDLQSAQVFNLSNCRYYFYKILKDGRMTKKQFDKLKFFGALHRRQNTEYWKGGMETTWITFLKFDPKTYTYTFDPDDRFYRYITKIRRDKVLLEPNEMMEDQKRFVTVC